MRKKALLFAVIPAVLLSACILRLHRDDPGEPRPDPPQPDPQPTRPDPRPQPKPARSGFEVRLLQLINNYRAANGLGRLVSSPKLNALAREHSAYQNQVGKLSHDGFSERSKRAQCGGCVENVGWNYHTPQAQFRGWKNSPGHNRNMLRSYIRKSGIAKVGPYVTFFACSCK